MITCLLLGPAWAIADTVMLETEQESNENGQVATFNFSQQLIFVRQYPSTLCQQCIFYLKPTSFSKQQLDELAHEEVISIRPLSGAWMRDARYQGTAQGEISITVNFSQTVSIAVSQDANKRTLKLDVSDAATKDQPKTEAVPATTTPVVKAVTAKTPTQKPAVPLVELKPKQPTLFDIMHPEDKAPPVMYVINLESSTATVDLSKLKEMTELSKYESYVTKTEIRKQVWQRGRLGFFNSMQEALDVLPTVTTQFTQAWVDKATEEERQRAANWYKQHAADSAKALAVLTAENAPAVETVTESIPPVTAAIPAATTKGVSGQNAVSEAKPDNVPTTPGNVADPKKRELFEHARQAMIDGNYDLAISLYTKILTTSKGDEWKDAKEFLGVARERNGQLAHAKAEYTECLKLYPDGSAATERIKQRLIGLATARSKPKVDLGNAEPKKEKEVHWDFNNSISQSYRNQTTTTDAAGKTTTDNSLSSDFSSSGRYRGEKYDIRTQLNVSNRKVFLDSASNSSPTNISTLYVDVNNKDLGLSSRIGRQSTGSDGVLGRFDGAQVSYRLAPQWKLNAVVGDYINTSSSTAQDDKSFYGVSADIGTLANHWDLKVYAINQTVAGIEDRRAIGSEVKYIDNSFSVFSALDYDIDYSSLNTIFFVGNWRFKDNSSLNLSMDYRNSPTITTSNALSGQSAVTTITQFLQGTPLIPATSTTAEIPAISAATESEIRQLAADRTAHTQSVNASYSFSLNEKYQMSVDMSVSNTSGTPASGTVAETPSSGNSYSLSTQLIGTNILTANDITVYGLRYSSASTSQTLSGTMSTRLAFENNNNFHLNPRVGLDKQDQTNGSSRLSLAPAIRMDYRFKNNVRLDGELGYQYSKNSSSSGDTTESGFSMFIGYFYDF
jgi:hypothetical protein